MAIFKISDDYKNFQTFCIDPFELIDKMPGYQPRLIAEPKAQIWNTPEASFFVGSACEKTAAARPQITTWGLGNLVMSPAAYCFLSPLLAHSGEVLPVSIYNETYYAFNTLRFIPDRAMDVSHAVDHIEFGMRLGKSGFRFDGAKIDSSLTVFKTRADMGMYSYCTQAFVDRVKALNLHGLIFSRDY